MNTPEEALNESDFDLIKDLRYTTIQETLRDKGYGRDKYFLRFRITVHETKEVYDIFCEEDWDRTLDKMISFAWEFQLVAVPKGGNPESAKEASQA
ncbi:hypothetical protein ETB97_011025 [Aspergillus alliaceus]|uniref:Uncharacterized protein n=1 Tax=Petromyces alliaceus TaxID=209559 RepID=A0A8H6A873_PETAA|nr:hypothetical protein ETB97_011025 [Aspergillus burnettii]